MKTVLSYAKTFNQSVKDQFLAWENYRNQLSISIKKNLNHQQENLLIIGPGNLNDLDMKMIKPFYKQITLLDIDTSSVIEGLKNQHLDPNEFQIVEYDLTSFDELDFFPSLNHLFNSEAKLENIQSFIDDTITQMKTKIDLPIEKFYDTIIILPIYTQLIYHQFLAYTSYAQNHHKMKFDVNKLNELMLNHMIDVIDHVNFRIQSVLKPSGHILCFSDIIQIEKHSTIYKNLENTAFNTKDIKTYYQSYVSKYGYGLGDYGLYSLSRKLLTCDEDWFIWPFHMDYHYIVKFQSFMKKDKT